MPDLERELLKDAYKYINNLARNAAKEVMNDLAEAGPEWSGEFKDSWVAHSPSAGSSGGGGYPYKLADIPQLPVTKKEAERRNKFVIENVAKHAAVAMDLAVPSDGFKYPGYGPVGDVVARGSRPEGGRRGDVSGPGDSRSTAPLDWYTLYAKGGKMDKAVERGVRLTKSTFR